MPHATESNGTMSSSSLPNGEPSSKFLSHVTSYPVVNDSIETFKQNPYGKKSLELANDTYQKFGKPVEPYLETPYSYAKPYVTKADELAASGLGHVDTRFPIVKEDTHTVVDTAKSYVFWPFKLAGDSRDYVIGTWQDEYKKTANHKDRGPGLSTSVIAIISTELKIASDVFQAIADFLGPRYEESKKKGSEYVREAQDKAGEYAQIVQDKQQEFQKIGHEKAQHYQKVGQENAEQAKEQASKTKEEAKARAGQK